MTKETVLFGLGGALPLVFNSELLTGGATFRSRAASMLAPATFVELIAGLYTFSLWVELLLVPFTVILAVAGAGSKRPRTRVVVGLLLSTTGLVFVIFSILSFLVTAHRSDWEMLAQTVVYVVVVSLATVVYAIVFGIWVTFTDKVMWLSFKREPGMLARYKGVTAILAVYAGRTRLLGATPPFVIMQMSRTKRVRDAIDIARTHLADKAQGVYDAQAKANALLEFADIDGVNRDGKQLDRREFRDTCDALDWVATCMIGQYNRSSRFRREVLDIVAPFTRQGLPEQHGIHMRVDPSGRRWYAFRRTITGWVFAVGGNSQRDQWQFDGSEPPTGYPSADSGWVQFAGSINWE